MTLSTLHYSIGPVQGFVGRSRRTRDLWASSFLLSYLAGMAIDAIRDQQPDPEIVLPDIYDKNGNLDPMLKAIRDVREGHDPSGPSYGSLPNRFQVRCRRPTEAARAATEAVEERWQSIAEVVWDKYISPAATYGDGTREIWDEQVANFWSIYWVESEDSDALDRRKNWRHRFPPAQSGDKCTMMHRWQELSGYHRGDNRKKQKEFWEAVRDKVGGLDLRENERLCAIAMIKRMFPRVAEKTIGWPLNATHWPSTAYMAAAPWLDMVAEQNPEVAQDYAQAVQQRREAALGEWSTRLPGLNDHPNAAGAGRFFDLDGNFYFSEAVESPDSTPLDEDRYLPEGETGPERAELCDKLDDLYGAVGDSGPSRFYALLLMDGDRMGAILQEAASKGSEASTAVSQALTSFSQSVNDVFEDKDGVLVYAGGDDVLAFVTLPDVFAAAEELRGQYEKEFRPLAESGEWEHKFTISAGIVIPHYKYPLRDVLGEAHHLLDEVAKEGTGRNSVAISVLKPGGKQYEWSQPWMFVRSGDERTLALDMLAELVKNYRKGEYSTSLLYRLRDLLMLYSPEAHWKPGMTIDVPEDSPWEAIVRAQYAHSQGEDSDAEEVKRAVQPLLDVSAVRHSDDDPESPSCEVSERSFDGWLLMRFLAQQRREDNDE